ncbi:SMP-30/gluconolactonase/LRE family protein [Dyella sp. 20L07]|uniref:SMP-30/gluconolactonase/LRE family protein n=1 Tax=Dyella sp. 20L07 TaxID=3384240 RepID=UPI003D28DE24
MTAVTTLPLMSVALAAEHILGEGILWCERTESLYWTDIQRATLFRLHPSNGVLAQWPMPERLASFALCEADGWLLLALASRLAFFRLADGFLQTLHDVEAGLPTRCNDGACDRQGRFVFGTMHEPAHGPRQTRGSFWRLNADLSLETLALPQVAISNSIAFSPDGGTMYYCDSLSRRIHCCTYGNRLGTPRLFTDLGDVTGEPDGSCVDAQGSLWNAQWGMGRVVCYAADGSEKHILPVPARQPTRPAFGGPTLDTLYVISARDGLSEAALADDPKAGSLFEIQTDVRGLPEPRFAGMPS